MSPQTERSANELRRLLRSAACIHQPALERAIDALLRSAEVEQVLLQRIRLLESKPHLAVNIYIRRAWAKAKWSLREVWAEVTA